MKRSARLNAEQRRQAIVAAVRSLFSEKGFHASKTRELAQAAGVSEALIYKHFPSKQTLYAAMLDDSARGPWFVQFHRILKLDPSVSTLVIMVHFSLAHYARNHDPDKSALNALMARSLLEDGEFARLTYEKYAEAWRRKFEACLKHAAKSGDLDCEGMRGDLCMWFVHHVGFSLMLHRRPAVPAITYKASEDSLIEQACYFALRGVGLKEEAIRRHYNSQILALLDD